MYSMGLLALLPLRYFAVIEGQHPLLQGKLYARAKNNYRYRYQYLLSSAVSWNVWSQRGSDMAKYAYDARCKQ